MPNPQESGKLFNVPKTTLKDVLTSSGREQIEYSKAVKALDALLAPYAATLINLGDFGDEFTPILYRRDPKENDAIKPSYVRLKERKYGDGFILLHLDHRSKPWNPGEKAKNGNPALRSYWKIQPHWDLVHRTTVLSIKNGEISDIASGRYEDHDDESTVFNLELPHHDAMLRGNLSIKEETVVLNAMVASLRAAADVSAVGLDQVP